MSRRNLSSTVSHGNDSKQRSDDEQRNDDERRSQNRFTLTPGTIADQLRQRLLALSYPAFAQCLCVLLEALGYEEAQPAGRQEWKGYNRPGGGGYDLEAVLPGGLTLRRAVAQIKQFDGLNVHQRSVDELRGACLRCGAAEAVLVTTSAFSKVVLKHAAVLDASSTQLAPVRLIDGKELLGLLIRHRLGVKETANGGAYRLELDEAFFLTMSAFEAVDEQSETVKPLPSTNKPRRAENPNKDLRGDRNLELDESLEWKMTIYLSGNSGPTTEKAVKRPLKRGGR